MYYSRIHLNTNRLLENESLTQIDASSDGEFNRREFTNDGLVSSGVLTDIPVNAIISLDEMVI